MKTGKRLDTHKIVLLSVIPILVIGAAIVIPTLTPGAKSNHLTAKLSEIAGSVEARNSVQDLYNPVTDGFTLKSTMGLQTKEQSRVRLDLSIGSIVRLGPSTIFSLESPQTSPQGLISEIELQAGELWIILSGQQLNVNTPAGLASVRGTYMSVLVDPNTHTVTVTCLEGSCGYTNNAGDVDMTSGQKIISSNMNILPVVQKMNQTDIQSWLQNSPESIPIVTQVSGILATSTPTVTPETVSSNPSTSPTPSLTPQIITNNLTVTAKPSFTPVTATPSSTPVTATNFPTVSLNPIFSSLSISSTPRPVVRHPKPKATKRVKDGDNDKDKDHDKDDSSDKAESLIQLINQLFLAGLPIRL